MQVLPCIYVIANPKNSHLFLVCKDAIHRVSTSVAPVFSFPTLHFSLSLADAKLDKKRSRHTLGTLPDEAVAILKLLKVIFISCI